MRLSGSLPQILALVCLSAFSSAAAAQSASATSLPDPRELLNRAIANEKKLAAEQERYDCQVTSEGVETDKNGKVKKDEVAVKEQFYVNGVQIERTLSKNGRVLSPEETRKEDERVMKKTVKYSDRATAAKESAKQEHDAEEIMAAMMLVHGRREWVNGHSTLVYDVVPNPHFQPGSMIQRFATVMEGTLSIDEQTGEPVDVNIKSTKDLKIAGGLVATLGKGFWLHIHNSPQPDGVWLTDLAEGSGNARALLFMHPYFRFKEVTNGCHLYTTTVTDGRADLAAPPSKR